MVGWTATPADLFAIQALLHDRLIVHLGTRRRGGVEWAVVTINEARALLDKMRAFTENPQLLAQYGLLEQTMAVRGGYLVVAHAPATPP